MAILLIKPDYMAFMLGFKKRLSGFLAKHGYLLTRVEREPAPPLSVLLAALKKRAAQPFSMVCLDNEVRIQSEILKVFPEERVSFYSPLFSRDDGALMTGSILPPAPVGSFVAAVDLETFPLDKLMAKLPWLKQADALLLRARLGTFWAGELDLCCLMSQIDDLGFHLADVISSFCISSPQAPLGNSILMCERAAGAFSNPRGSRYRVVEALTYLSRPIVRRMDFRLLASRGSLGFAAGVCNPGAIREGGQRYLVSKAERTPWPLQKTDESRFFTSAQPLLLKLEGDSRIAGADELAMDGAPGTSRVEDFRLFKFRGEILSNHAVISKPHHRPAMQRPLQLDLMQTRIGISTLNVSRKRLAWHGFPVTDRPLARTEKNWVFFTDGDRLFLLYSFSPYVLLSAQNWPGLDFKTIVETRLELPIDGDGLTLRNSINPVDYDENHWLHIVHKVHPGKQYSFWAVLLNKQTLQPARMTARPLVCGWRSVSASIIYVCSAIVEEREVLFFAGLDDSTTAMAAISRERLDAEWVDIPREEPNTISEHQTFCGATRNVIAVQPGAAPRTAISS